jgi:hypothetical protein
VGVPPGELRDRSGLESDLFWVEKKDVGHTVSYLGYPVGALQGEFIESSSTMYYQSMLRSQGSEDLSDGLYQFLRKYSHDLVLSAGRIGKRSKHVEECPYTEAFSRAYGVPCGCVVCRGKQEGDSYFEKDL